ncbi:SERINE/THREONINE-PROTEIN KINASE PEPKR2-LIKE ISOFORM X1 [Salix purpurea]|uniref:SERINE/THREONINE-PROTEIN KINASE PEPKR2-LIKE ISOFORM X1 n=1 Tax=Salix purpurea TaxID=77065 RepID=A0A9Q0ZHB4_SALPP|nr:SERINE/THREONINE-PROTEIN KINASE PEPKR2-LIKE ISOFORM X1 [Salix purpurea]
MGSFIWHVPPSINSNFVALVIGRLFKAEEEVQGGEDKEVVGSSRSVVKGVFTVPSCRSVSADPSCRGLKRKIGCIDAATQLGRKTKIEKEYDLDA